MTVPVCCCWFPQLDCSWLETRCLVCWVSFIIVSEGWTCTGMETTSWIHVPYMSSCRAFVMVWRVYSSHDTGSLKRLEMTLTCEGYVNILFNHTHPFNFYVHSDGLRHFLKLMRPPICRELQLSDCRNTILTSDTSISHLNFHTWTLLSISMSGMSWNVLFRRDFEHFGLLWISGLLCRFPGVTCHQDSFRR